MTVRTRANAAFALINRLFWLRDTAVPRLERWFNAAAPARTPPPPKGRKPKPKANPWEREADLVQQIGDFMDDLIAVAETQRPTAEDSLRARSVPSFSAPEPMVQSIWALFRGRSYLELLVHILSELCRQLELIRTTNATPDRELAQIEQTVRQTHDVLAAMVA